MKEYIQSVEGKEKWRKEKIGAASILPASGHPLTYYSLTICVIFLKDIQITCTERSHLALSLSQSFTHFYIVM